MSIKELIIELRIPLTGDMFTDAEVVTKAQGVHAYIADRAGAEFGEGNYTLSVAMPPVRTPRAPRADAGVPRGPRSPKNANGATKETADI